MYAWLFLFVAILFEVAGTTCMKLSEGFTRWVPSTLIFVFYAASFTFFTFALKRIDISIAYAVWGAVGIVAISIIGMARFGESVTPMKVFFIAVIVVGVIGLRLSGGGASIDG